MDANQLQTALQIAADSEDFQTAGRIRDELRARQSADGCTSWQQLGVPDWLADRAEQYGLRFPTGKLFGVDVYIPAVNCRCNFVNLTALDMTCRGAGQTCVEACTSSTACPCYLLKFARPQNCAEVQARAAEVLQARRDCIIQSETGSGKTLLFLMPVLSQLDFPPETPLTDFEVHNGIICEQSYQALQQVAVIGCLHLASCGRWACMLRC